MKAMKKTAGSLNQEIITGKRNPDESKEGIGDQKVAIRRELQGNRDKKIAFNLGRRKL